MKKLNTKVTITRNKISENENENKSKTSTNDNHDVNNHRISFLQAFKDFIIEY
jgi:hypothetical protein